MMLNNKSIRILFFSIVLFGCNSSDDIDDPDKQNSERPITAITYQEASSLQRNYIETRATFINEHLITNGTLIDSDVRDVTYKLSDLKQYIAYFEEQASKKGLAVEDLRIRVYMGAYPTSNTNSSSEDTNYDEGELGYATMFFMPAKRKGAGRSTRPDSDIFEDIDGLNFGAGGKPPHDLD